MIFPDHCRCVGVVDRYARPGYRREDVVYFSSRYVLVLEAPGECEVYGVEGEGQGLLRKPAGLRKIAGAGETLVYGPPVDITNRALLIKTAAGLCRAGINTVVFRGADLHYTFIHRPDPSILARVDIYDTAPPWPPWLAENVRLQDAAGMYGDLLLDFSYRITDLKRFEDPSRTTIFPCRASGLDGLFLDSLDREPEDGARLVGCGVSRLVFEAKYPEKPFEHVNVCPLASSRPASPFLLRCCQSERLGPKDADGVPGVAVHWGASPREIYDAVRLLASRIRR